jgi:phosphatidate cytidylyltransferase
MFLQRTLVAAILLPLGVLAIMAGGLWLAGSAALLLGLAVWEYVALYRQAGHQPASRWMLLGVLGLVVVRHLYGVQHDAAILVAFLLGAMGLHLLAYERGRDAAATDYLVTLSGGIYIGLLGSYMVLLRALPQGQWWLLLSLSAVWLADSAAYLFGVRIGRHKMTPRLSPHKSWEGYLAGVLFGVLGTPLLLAWFQRLGLPDAAGFSSANAAILGAAMSILPTLGDLGESMIKRHVGQKDSGSLLPGHGGIFDRIDSWLWAMPIAYYLITYVFV